MTVRLRPHHLLCLTSYIGKGYTPAFTASYDAIAARLSAGEDIEIVSGPDDICAPLLADDDAHCRAQSVADRDRLAARDAGALLGAPIRAGTRIALDAARLTRLRENFAKGSIRAACAGCDWAELCGAVAASGFKHVRVQPR